MDVLADSGMLAVTDLQQLVFQAMAFVFGTDPHDSAGGLGSEGLDGDSHLRRGIVSCVRGQVERAHNAPFVIEGNEGECPQTLAKLDGGEREVQVRELVEHRFAPQQQFDLGAVGGVPLDRLGKGGGEADVRGQFQLLIRLA